MIIVKEGRKIEFFAAKHPDYPVALYIDGLFINSYACFDDAEIAMQEFLKKYPVSDENKNPAA